jgi:hypothetical protein
MKDDATIAVRYSCPDCGLVGAICAVSARGDEDVIAWTEKVLAVALSEDHRRRSPWCTPKGLKDVMIPITGADKVGGPSLQ